MMANARVWWFVFWLMSHWCSGQEFGDWDQALSRGLDGHLISLTLPLVKHFDEVRWNSSSSCSCGSAYSNTVTRVASCLHLGQLQSVFCYSNKVVSSKQGTVVMHEQRSITMRVH